MILFLFASTLKFTFVKFKGLVNSNQLRCWCAFFLLNYFGFELCVIFYTFSFHLWFSEAKSIIAPWFIPVAMEVEESVKEDTGSSEVRRC